MRPLFQICIVVVVALWIPYASAQTQAGRLATLEIRVTDSFGDAVQDWRLTKLADRTGKDWKSSLGTGGIARIPAGYYSLRIEHNKFLTFDGTVHVRLPTTLYIAGMVMAGFEDNPAGDQVRGRFEVAPGANSWCKLSGIETVQRIISRR